MNVSILLRRETFYGYFEEDIMNIFTNKRKQTLSWLLVESFELHVHRVTCHPFLVNWVLKESSLNTMTHYPTSTFRHLVCPSFMERERFHIKEPVKQKFSSDKRKRETSTQF